MPRSILIVDADPATRGAAEEVLRHEGYTVRSAATFEDGKRLLLEELPDLLIADVRLGAFNGLHLVLRFRSLRPQATAIVTHTVRDKVLKVEAAKIGASFLVKPIEPAKLRTAVERALDVTNQYRPVRRWPRKRVVTGLTAQVGEQAARVVDVSYGGLRLEVPNPPGTTLPENFVIDLPNAGLSLQAELVWMNPAPGTLYYGAALDEDDRIWRQFVDSVN